jgi:hypothetical protein
VCFIKKYICYGDVHEFGDLWNHQNTSFPTEKIYQDVSQNMLWGIYWLTMLKNICRKGAHSLINLGKGLPKNVNFF